MRKILSMPTIRKFVGDLFDEILHAKQVTSISHAVLGAVHCVRLSSTRMGHAMATERGVIPKHAIKQVDRLLGNTKVRWKEAQRAMIRYLVGARKQLVVSLDWTEYGGDCHSQITLNLVTEHGRATPLLWRTVPDNRLKNNRSAHERALLRILKKMLPAEMCVTVLADRGFAGGRFYDYIGRVLGWDYVIRLRENTFVTANDGQYFKVRERVPPNGRLAEFTDAMVTAKECIVRKVVCVKKHGMKESWSLVTSLSLPKEEIIELYSRRFTCEEHFRDAKDDRFGVGLKETRVSTPVRRDRLLLIYAISVILLTLLGKTGETLGYDRRLRANTVKIRTHSLFRQGREYVKGVLQSYLTHFLALFDKLLACHPQCSTTYATL